MANVAGAQEVVLSTSGGLGEADTSGVMHERHSARRRQHVQRHVFASGANGAMQGSNYTQALKDQGLRTPSELLKVCDFNPMGGGPIIRDKLWFYLTYRDVGRGQHGSGHVGQQERRQPERVDRRFRQEPAGVQRRARTGTGSAASRGRRRRATRLIVYWSEQRNASGKVGGGTATQTRRSDGPTIFYNPSHIQQATWSSPVTSRVLLEAGWGTTRRGTATRRRGWTARTTTAMIRTQEQGGEIPDLISRMPGGTGGGFNHHLIGTLAANRGVGVVCHAARTA